MTQEIALENTKKELTTSLASVGLSVKTKTPFHLIGEGHTNSIFALALSADGRTLFTGSHDKTARAWDVATGRQLRIFEGHTDRVNTLALSADGRTLFTGYYTVRAWDVATGRQLRIFQRHSQSILALALSSDGGTLFTGSVDHIARAWDVATGRQLRIFEGHTNEILALALSADGCTLFTGSWDYTARAWDVATGRQLRIFEGHNSRILALSLSADGRTLFTGSYHGTVRAWNAQTGEHLATLYHIKKGFLWTTPPDEASKYGWFWTERPEIITVLKADDDGSNHEVLADDDQERLDYIRDHNRQDIVMSRINDPEKYQRLIDYFTDKIEAQGLENQIKENSYRLSFQKK